MYKGSTYRNIHKHIKNHVHKHMGKHIFKHAHKVTHHANHIYHVFSHLGELILVGFMGFVGLMFAGGSNLPNNTSFSYPLQKVSTLECRTLYRNDMPDSCKINLPIIHGANYAAYENDSTYRSIYTTLRAAPYSDSWNQKLGAHAGVDMATARGTPLYSIGDGEVYSAGPNSAYGNVVKIKYVYNGEIVYAVYAHMDSIDIKAGDMVVKGQRIGAVGNSGNTFGKLGGYHVHFEIDKDNYGRPAYSYTNCPDLSKGHYKIIQNGLCRTELFTYQYDPIRVFESNSTYVSEDDMENDSESDKDIIKNEQEIAFADTGSNTTDITDSDITDIDIIDDEENNNQDDEDLNQEDENIDKWQEIIENDVQDINEDHSSAELIVEDITMVEEVEEVGIQQQETIILYEDKTLLELDFEGVNLLAKHLLSLWEIEMHSDLLEKNLSVGETMILDINIFKKDIYTGLTEDQIKEVKEKNKKHNRYKGILKEPFIFVASNDNIDIDINYLQLITKGKAQVQITGEKRGKSSMVIEFGGKKIGMLDITIK